MVEPRFPLEIWAWLKYKEKSYFEELNLRTKQSKVWECHIMKLG